MNPYRPSMRAHGKCAERILGAGIVAAIIFVLVQCARVYG